MTTEPTLKEQPKTKVIHQGGASEAVYGLGLIGACVYYFSHATTIVVGLIGFLKAIVWPAILVYEALKYLQL
jgi:hypothetical protein